MPLTINGGHMSNELTYLDRQMIQYQLRTKKSLRNIARVIGIDHSILSREIRRNSSGREKYRADTAQRFMEKRKFQKHVGKMDKHPILCAFVEQKLREDWSPEQIAGVLRLTPPAELAGIYISHESIYYWIYEKAEKHKKLHTHLRTHRPKRQKIGRRKGKKMAIPKRISIHNRPTLINQKKRYGDWESDTVEFERKKENGYLSVQYERKSQLVRIHKMSNKTAEETRDALTKTAESVPQELLQSITFDNGTEGVLHTDIQDTYGVDTYFCDPYASWQKGGVENMNKLIRQYLPRKTDLNEFTDRDIYDIQEKLNNRPRKGLNYQTPNQVIHKVVH